MTFANKTIREWVVFREMTGHPSFSRADVVAAFPLLSPHAVSNALVRLAKSGVIVSVHKGFFCRHPNAIQADRCCAASVLHGCAASIFEPSILRKPPYGGKDMGRVASDGPV